MCVLMVSEMKATPRATQKVISDIFYLLTGINPTITPTKSSKKIKKKLKYRGNFYN